MPTCYPERPVNPRHGVRHAQRGQLVVAGTPPPAPGMAALAGEKAGVSPGRGIGGSHGQTVRVCGACAIMPARLPRTAPSLPSPRSSAADR